MTITTLPTIATHPLTNRSLEALRDIEVLRPYFDQLDAGEPAHGTASQALFFDGERGEAIEFAQAVLRERCDVELTGEDELTELALIEMLDPAKGFPPLEVRCRAALLVLAWPTATAEERRNNAYLANYLTDEPNIGLAVAMNDLRARYGLEPTGW